jgi:hypothetical protein
MKSHSSAARAATLPLLLAALAGCGSASEPTSTVEIAVQPYEVPSGEEVLRCQEMALPSDTDVDVDQITWHLGAGSHHVHVYVSGDGSTGAEQRIYDCPQTIDFARWHLLAATQDGAHDWKLPRGTALHIKARQSILVQTHYLNTGSEPLTASASVSLCVASPGSVERRAAAIFGQDRDIDIQPHSTGHVEGTCALPGPGAVLAMMGHYHLHGRGFQAWISAPGKDRQVVYRAEDGTRPEWVTFPELPFGQGASLGWSCDYQNPLGVPVEYGPLEGTQEHCNLFAFYTEQRGDATFLPCVVKTKTER